MNYEIIDFKDNREEWLKNRCIGGTDLAKIVNKVARWGNFIELYDEIKNPTYDDYDNDIMRSGRLAEEHIKQLFLIANPQYKRYSPEGSLLLVKRLDYPEMTLSPDTLVMEGDEKGFIEIKKKIIYSEKEIEPYLTELKEQEPQYRWQCMHHFVVMDDNKFGLIVVCFELHSYNEERKDWEFDKFIINSLKMRRENVEEDVKEGEKETIDFIVNNLRKNHKPTTKLKGQKEEKIEWSKLSNIQILRN